MTTKRKQEPKATEGELLALLERRHAGTGNGGSGEYAFLTHVRNDGGFSATRTFDAVAVSLWPSRGYAIDVYEVKVSRSDWLRELNDPAKSEAAWAFGDRFWIVATAGLVDHAELPHGWGLIEASGAKVTDEGLTGRRLRTVKAAEWHGEPVKKSAMGTIPKGLMVSMLRRAGAVPDQELPSERMLTAAERRGHEAATASMQALVDRATDRESTTAAAVHRFERLSGVTVVPRHATAQEGIDDTAKQIRAALADEGHADRVRARLEQMRDQLRHAAEQVEYLLEHPDERPTSGRVVGL